jgi:hypothetical protein
MSNNYKKLYKITKNKVKINVEYLREIYTEDNHEEIINSVIKTNRKILKKYPKFIYVISMETVSITDIVYYNFFKKLLIKLKHLFREELECVYLTNTSDVFYYLFGYLSVFINKDTYEKIKFDDEL